MGDTYSIFQLKSGDELHFHRFVGLDTLEREGNRVDAKNYDKVYTGSLRDNCDTKVMLDYLYAKFNRDHPADFKGHSLSVSDIIVIEKAGKSSAYYVDTFGFKEVTDFFTPDMPDMSDFMRSEKRYRYMLLDRLRSDCEYYLGYGNRFAGHLWAGNEKGQMYAMKELWNSFSDSEKPEWLTYDKILEYEKAMTGEQEKAPTGDRYYKTSDGWFDYYVNADTGEKKFKLDAGDVLVDPDLDDFSRPGGLPEAKRPLNDQIRSAGARSCISCADKGTKDKGNDPER